MSAASTPPAANTALDWEPLFRACATLTPELNEILAAFRGASLRIVFLGVGTKAHYFWRMDDFHVSQLSLGQQRRGIAMRPVASPEVLLKLSDGLCAAFLDNVLGPKAESFSLKDVSLLEASLLNELSRELLGRFRKTFIQTDYAPERSNRLETICRMIWGVTLAEKRADSPDSAPEGGKIILEAPLNALRLEKKTVPPENSPNVPDAFFFHIRASARIAVGGTRLALSDLDGLESGDLIVLEESNAGTMYLVEPCSLERIRFSPLFRQRAEMTLPYPRELAMTDPQSSVRQTLWDNLMIEVNAELEPVRLPLKQLKEMTEGLVVEMGDLVDNRVSLHVGGKVLAWGELVIVGDKFGVRVSRLAPDALEADKETTAETIQASAPEHIAPAEPLQHAEPAPPEPVAETSAEEFLNQDFEAFDEDEEEW